MLLTGGALLLAGAVRAFSGEQKSPLVGPRYVVAVGDSLTANGSYCRTLERMLPVGSRVDCVGYVGEGAQAISTKVGKAILAGADDVIVLAGVNDLASGRGVQGTVSGLDKIYQKGRASGARVIAVHLTPWAGHSKGSQLQTETWKVNAWMAKYPSVEMVVETQELGDAGVLYPEYGAGDGLHLSEAGQDKLAEIIFSQVYGG